MCFPSISTNIGYLCALLLDYRIRTAAIMFLNYYMNQHAHSNDQKNEVNLPIQPYIVSQQRLAPFVDLRMWMTPVQQQENTNTWYSSRCRVV